MVYKYIGTIPKDANKEYQMEPQSETQGARIGSVPTLPHPGKFNELELPDSDSRAVSYVAGSAPNAWGYLADGSTVAEIGERQTCI
jgi:hypothetical protein